MFDIQERTNDVGRRIFVVVNLERGRDLASFRFYDDAAKRVRDLCNARIRRLRAANERQADQSAGA